MAWVRLDDGFFRHRKVVELTDKAKLLHLSALCMSSSENTDGRLTAGMVKVAAGIVGASARLAGALVDAGVWERTVEGFLIHDYLTYNPSAEQRAKSAEETKQRVQKWREKRSSNGVGNAVTNGVRTHAPQPQPLAGSNEPAPPTPQRLAAQVEHQLDAELAADASIKHPAKWRDWRRPFLVAELEEAERKQLEGAKHEAERLVQLYPEELTEELEGDLMRTFTDGPARSTALARLHELRTAGAA